MRPATAGSGVNAGVSKCFEVGGIDNRGASGPSILGGPGGMLPLKFLKSRSLEMLFSTLQHLFER